MLLHIFRLEAKALKQPAVKGLGAQEPRALRRRVEEVDPRVERESGRRPFKVRQAKLRRSS